VTAQSNRSIRCAVYTRKSSEEGLEQSFNSLDAQREACLAYIQSQRQEGWRALPAHYDDGGFSGGSMDRPALKQLLTDIEARKIDTVVVYKVDRLTRSLADFAKIVEAFDSRGISFVSVTQQFNTTSSMGRLTLNVLLSFAQFEREVTGERIRDKIAASKRKGMWMGGCVPLGYDVRDRHLVVNKEEAEQVREIFRLYLRFGCVQTLKKHLDAQGIKSKIRISFNGRSSGGTQYSRGALYKILGNKTYLGEIPHKDQSYPGEHQAIVERDLWERVRLRMLEGIRGERYGTRSASPSLLRGLVYDEHGNRFTPDHAVKRGKRYRYYVSRAPVGNGNGASNRHCRIPASELERVVLNELRAFLCSERRLVDIFANEHDVDTTRRLIESAAELGNRLRGREPGYIGELLSDLAVRLVIHENSVEIEMNRDKLYGRLLGTNPPLSGTSEARDRDPIVLGIASKLKRYNGTTKLIVDGTSHHEDRSQATVLIKAVTRAHDWMQLIVAGRYKDQRAIAAALGLDERYVSKIISAAFLAPTIVELILKGAQPAEMTLQMLVTRIPLSWLEQYSDLIDAK
jgi:site-specific DNA recombinase